MHTFLLAWFNGIERRLRPLGVTGHSTGTRQLRVVIGPIPVAAPLPYVARDVIKVVRVRWELRDWCGARETVAAIILNGKCPLESVRHELAARTEFVSPGIDQASLTTTRRELELGFRGQS